MAKKLTDTAVKTAKPKEKPYKVADGDGLYVLVNPGGGKLWRLKYRFEGKEKLLAIGTYPAVSLKEARARAVTAKEMIARGIDPCAARKAAKAEALAKSLTFEVVAREWHKKKLAGWTPNHARQIIRRLETLAFPDLGSRPIAELGSPDFLAVLGKVERQGHLETARRLAQICGQVTRYARLAGMIVADPASHLTRSPDHKAGAPPCRHHRTAGNRRSAPGHRRLSGGRVRLLCLEDHAVCLCPLQRAAAGHLVRDRPGQGGMADTCRTHEDAAAPPCPACPASGGDVPRPARHHRQQGACLSRHGFRHALHIGCWPAQCPAPSGLWPG